MKIGMPLRGENTMQSKSSREDPAFLALQKQRLIMLANQLRSIQRGQTDEQLAVNADNGTQAREFEDDAQKLAELELTGNLAAADAQRLRNVERALQKIEEGTYGISDRSGTPIPRARLEASPEAVYTLEEQVLRDRGSA
jgi:DnaK suppressor protein